MGGSIKATINEPITTATDCCQYSDLKYMAKGKRNSRRLARFNDNDFISCPAVTESSHGRQGNDQNRNVKENRRNKQICKESGTIELVPLTRVFFR